MKNCTYCGESVDKLIAIDNADVSAGVTELIGNRYSSTDYYCVRCAMQIIGITNEDLAKDDRIHSKNPDFLISLLKGHIGQVIIECVFKNFGYEVYPYGYENHLTSIIKNIRKNWSNKTIKQIRSTPDILIYDRERNDGFLIEIKSTTLNPSNYWIESKQLKKYIELWGSAILTIVHFPTLKVFCKAFNQISLDNLPEKSPGFAPNLLGYSINLEEQFSVLSKQFRLIDFYELTYFIDRIKIEILNKYSS